MEWMWAAMGADTGSPGALNTTGYTKAFAGSDGINAVGDYAWYLDNSGSKTNPVGGKLPNELSLSDMSGNVWEWCWDWYAAYPAGALSDYRGGSGGNRVMRGGSWFYSAVYATVAYRNSYYPNSQYGNIGFRVVRP